MYVCSIFPHSDSDEEEIFPLNDPRDCCNRNTFLIACLYVFLRILSLGWKEPKSLNIHPQAEYWRFDLF